MTVLSSDWQSHKHDPAATLPACMCVFFSMCLCLHNCLCEAQTARGHGVRSPGLQRAVSGQRVWWGAHPAKRGSPQEQKHKHAPGACLCFCVGVLLEVKPEVYSLSLYYLKSIFFLLWQSVFISLISFCFKLWLLPVNSTELQGKNGKARLYLNVQKLIKLGQFQNVQDKL